MLDIFLGTLSPVGMLFIFMAIGFALRKASILPDNATSTLAKLETWVFCPALSFMCMAKNFTVEEITSHARNISFALVMLVLALSVGIPLSFLFVRKKSYERSIYQYALVFSNLGYMADPLVQGMFGDGILAAYKLFCLPFTITIYTWGIAILTPGKSKGFLSVFKRIMNPSTIAMLLGMIVGITGLHQYILTDGHFITKLLTNLQGCMGPVAMILAGISVASYSFKDLIKDKKVYLAAATRLVILPTVLVAALIGIKALVSLVLGIEIPNDPIYLAFFASAMPLGMNTIVFPAAYGGDPKPGASMALISSVLALITIPLMFSLLSLIIPMPWPLN